MYLIHGIVMASELPLPGMPAPPGETEAEVTITLGAVPGEPPGEARLDLEGEAFLLRIPGAGSYRISGGREIRIEVEPGADPDRVRLFLLGSAMGGLLYQRGLFPLHGSALETRGGAVLLLGPSGSGKSTLAHHFRRRGYRLLSDDVCAIAPRTGDRPRVFPALPQLRLCPDALAGQGVPAPGQRLDGDKFLLALEKGFCPEPRPLRGICVLDAHPLPDPLLEPITGFGRVQTLLENLYRPAYLKALPEKGGILRMAAGLAEDTPLMRLRRRWDPEGIEATVDCLERAWNLQSAAPEDLPPWI